MTRMLRGAMYSLALSTAACTRVAKPFIADSGSITINLDEVYAAAGFRSDAWVAHMDTVAAIDSRNEPVRVLRVVPSQLRVHVGDTITPLQVVRVTGLDAAGAVIADVAPLFGPFRPRGVVRTLSTGTWLAERVGRSQVEVRVLRIAHAVSNDTAMVRAVTVEVVP